MALRAIDPRSLGAPRGYSNGMLAPVGGQLLFVAGQIAWDESQKIVGPSFGAQFERALSNVIEVVRAAGGEPSNLARLTIYVTDKSEYEADLEAVGAAYRSLMGKHFPAMALLEVRGLLEPGAKVEIEATAVIEDSPVIED